MGGLCGYRRNPERRSLVSLTAGQVASTYPPFASLSRYSVPPFHQGGTSSCVGHARAKGIYVARAAAGKPLPWVPSPAFLYTIARCYERDYTGEPLVDDGCDPVDTLDAARIWGLRPMVALPDRYSDASEATINTEPDLRVLEEAAEWHTLDDFQVFGDHATRRSLVCASLASGFPVCIDVPGGSNAWQYYDSGTLQDISEAPLDHYVVLLGYMLDPSGRLYLFGHNSWGEDWGVWDSDVGTGGAFVVDESVLRRAQDVIVCVANEERNPKFGIGVRGEPSGGIDPSGWVSRRAAVAASRSATIAA